MLRVLDRLVQERLLLREPGVGPVRELAVEFVLTLIDRETGIEPEPAGDEIVDEGRPFRIAGLLVDDGEVGIAAVARRTRPHRRQRGQCNSRQQRLAHSPAPDSSRSEEHTSELQSLMRISYAVFFLKK